MRASKCSVVTPVPRDVWLEVLDADPMAFVYQTPIGLDAICAELGREDVSRLYEFESGRKLVLPLYGNKGILGGLGVVKSPLVGSIVSPGQVQPEELRAIFDDLASLHALRVQIRPVALAGALWDDALPRHIARVPHVSHVLDLQGGFETVWEQRFNAQARRAVRKAERSSLEVVRAFGTELLPQFLDLYMRSVERWAKQSGEPIFVSRWRAAGRLSELRRKCDVLGRACSTWVAYVDGVPAAAIVVLHGPNAHYTLGAMDETLAGPARATFLLQKLAIEDACSAGYRYYNMGETGHSETLARFKEHFGARPYRYCEYRIERLPLNAMERAARVAVKKATALLKRSPT